MKFAIHKQEETIDSVGSVVSESNGYLFIDVACQMSALLGVWSLTGKIKVAPKSECLQFNSEEECMRYLSFNSFSLPIAVEKVVLPDPEYTPETPL
jgi:hypothetical protein